MALWPGLFFDIMAESSPNFPAVILDCQSADSGLRLFAITMFERLCRQLFDLGIRRVYAVGLTDSLVQSQLRPDFSARFPLQIIPCDLRDPVPVEHDLILLQSNGLYDDRILAELVRNDELEVTAAGPHPVAVRFSRSPTMMTLADAFQKGAQGLSARVSIRDLAYYDNDLRQHIAPTFRLVDRTDNLRQIENDMYEMTFKGAMDFIASYGYKIPVRGLVRLLAPTRITPNIITVLSIACSILAVPFFAVGQLGLGIALGFLFIIFDSLDGKLARLTVHRTPAAGHWDRKTSTPAVAMWSLAWGWHFSEGRIESIPFYVGLAIFMLTIVDKWTRMAFRALTGKSILDYAYADRIFHLVASKRTTNLFILTLGVAMASWNPEAPEMAFQFILVWLLITWAWHVLRVAHHALLGKRSIRRNH